MGKTKIIKTLSFCAALCATAAIGTYAISAKAEDTSSPYDYVQLEVGASVRYAESADGMGLSYRLKMPVEQYNLIPEADEAIFGIYLAPQDYYEAHAFDNLETIEKYYTVNAEPVENTARLYDFQGIMGQSDGENVYFRGSLVGVLTQNLTRDFRAVGYVKYKVNGEYTYKFIQSDKAEDNIRSMAYVAEQAIVDNKKAIAATEDETIINDLTAKNELLQNTYINNVGDPFGDEAEQGGAVKVYDRADKTLSLPQVAAMEAAKKNTYWQNKYDYAWKLIDSSEEAKDVEDGASLADLQGDYTLVCVASKDGTEKTIYEQPYQINADFGATPYRRSSDTFTFDAVENAQQYDLYVDGEKRVTGITETQYEFADENALSTGNHTIRVVAHNGAELTEQTYIFTVGDKIRFNEAIEGNYKNILADFSSVEYREFLSVEGKNNAKGATIYSISDEKLRINPLSEWGYNQVLKFTFPTPIAKAEMWKICFKLTTTKAIRIYAFGEYNETSGSYEKTGTDWNGDWVMNESGSFATESIIEYSGFKKLTSDYVTGIAITCGANVSSTVVNLSEITYYKALALPNFNTLIEGTENEYLLADFSVPEYNIYLFNKNTAAKHTLTENGLEISGAAWDGNAITYSLPSAIALSDIEQIKVEFTVTGNKHGVVRASDGTNLKGVNNNVSPLTFTPDRTVLTGDNLVSFLLSCNDASTTITYTKITYTKKASN